MADYERPRATPEQTAEFLRRALANLNAGYYQRDPRMFPQNTVDFLKKKAVPARTFEQRRQEDKQLYDKLKGEF
jgi:hypothetical protein